MGIAGVGIEAPLLLVLLLLLLVLIINDKFGGFLVVAV